MKAVSKTLGLVNGNTVDVYYLEDGRFVYSENSVAKAINQQNVTVIRFLGSKQLEAILGKPYTAIQVEVEREGRGARHIKAIESHVASIYWMCNQEYQLAAAYSGSALDHLAAKAFGLVLDVAETAQDIYDKLRHDHKTIHNALQSHCQAHGYQPWKVSKLIAEAVTGRPYEDIMDGVEYRKAWSPDMVSLEELQAINKVKREFVNCRQRTTQANVLKACEKAKVQVKVVG